MENQKVLDDVNKKTYARADVVKHYDDLDMLHKPERILLERLTPEIKDKKILDIAIGGGRTTKYLLQISKDYTGIDYTPEFVEVAKRKYKDATILCCDARDLKEFADETFDFVLFAFNSIDYIPHQDRMKALSESYRVLKKGSYFMFSTHNRDHESFNKLPWQEKIPIQTSYLNIACTALPPAQHREMKSTKSTRTSSPSSTTTRTGFVLATTSHPGQLKQLAAVDFPSRSLDGEANG